MIAKVTGLPLLCSIIKVQGAARVIMLQKRKKCLVDILVKKFYNYCRRKCALTIFSEFWFLLFFYGYLLLIRRQYEIKDISR